MLAPDPFGLVGQVLDGQFRVDRHVGEGGFSIVYAGTHIGLSEPIAIKCLKLPAALGSALVDSFVRRFRDESRLHYRLSQGNLHIVRSMASGTTISPATSALVPYTVLEWLEGHSLAQEFNDRRAAGHHGRPMREVIELLDSAAQAMAFAHAQGVVHRDLNPGNLFLARTPSGTKLKILDFGVAKILADSAIAMNPTARTVGNVRMFAPAYGAPEQFDERVGTIGPWTDVYAIALVILEALSDVTVMEGEHLGEFATKALDARRPTPRTVGIAVGDEVEKTFAAAVALDPSKRPRDAGEFWGMLKHAIQVDARSGRPAHARATPGPDDYVPTTLRLEERGSRAPGGTLRLDRVSLSASDVLATPLRPSTRLSVAPAAGLPAAGAPAAAGAMPAAHVTPPPPDRGSWTPAPERVSAYTPTPPPAAADPGVRYPTPGTGYVSIAPQRPSAAPSGGRALVVLLVTALVVILGIAVAAAYAWRAWHVHAAPTSLTMRSP